MKAKVIAQILSIFADAVSEYAESYHIAFTPSDIKAFSMVTHNKINTLLVQFTAPIGFNTDLNDLEISLSDYMRFVSLPKSQLQYLNIGSKKIEPIYLKMITRKNEEKVIAEIVYVADQRAYQYIQALEIERMVNLI